MSNPARSIFVFGIYLALIGLGLLIVPNTLLGLFMLPATADVWIRVVGMLSLFLSFYFIQAARGEATAFFQWSVYVRSTTILFLIAFVLLGYATPYILPFGVIDLAGAIWTGLTLRSAKIA
jgi:hypothetical protein